MSKKAAERLWKSSKPAKVARTRESKSSKVVLDIPDWIFDELVAISTETGKKLSEVVNEIVREFLDNLASECTETGKEENREP